MPLGNYVAGAYGISFGTALGHIGAVVDIGRTEVGFEMIARPSFNVIRADETGRTPVEALFTGMEDIIVRVDLLEWSQAAGFQNWAAILDYLHQNNTEGKVEQSGTLVNENLADQLVLTPLEGEAADVGALGTTTAGTYTFPKAYPLEPVRTVFSSQRLRSLSVGFFVFAHDNASSVATMYSAVYT